MSRWAAVILVLGTFVANIGVASNLVECILTDDGKSESIQLKMGRNNKIVQWDELKWAQASEEAYWLSVFSEDIEEYGIEWSKSFVARNGYSILEIGTTGDAFIIGVNLKLEKGFFYLQRSWFRCW
jgi:hypothetical protein